MRGQSCELYPKANDGKDSKMYKDLLKTVEDRPLTNWIYASYVASNIGDSMVQANIMRNSQGQHNASDLLNFIDYYTKISPEINSLATEEKQLGAVDSNGQRVDFTDARVALDKANDFNDNHKGLVANVYQHGDVFNIIVSEKNARTHMHPVEVKERLQAWSIEKQVFAANGIDIDAVPAELRSVINPNNLALVKYLKNLKRSQFNYLFKQGAMALLFLNQHTLQVQRAINSFGSIEAAAQAVDDVNHGISTISSAQLRLLLNAINYSMQFNGVNLDALENQLQQVTQQVVSSSPEEQVRITLHKLNKQYNININEIHKTNREIRTLSDAAARAIITLERQIRGLEKEKGRNAEGRNLKIIQEQLLRELANKRYYSGILNFLNEANQKVSQIDTILNNTRQTGTELEIAFDKAKALQEIKDLWVQYYPLVSALASDHLAIDESIDQVDIDNIKQLAKSMDNFFNNKNDMINRLIKETMIDLLRNIIGDTAPDGQTIANVINMAQTDASLYEWLYSVGRSGNPIIAAMGSIIRNAQNGRNAVMNDMSLRIRRATAKLYKSGSDSKFMYESDGHIISDIDWVLYNTARQQHIRDLVKNGLKDFDLKQAIEDWEDANTEERAVDIRNGSVVRTERVPNSKYRKAFPNLTTAQMEYYKTMMQIKGEIGTLLPEYARNQYLPPQVRRSMVDAISESRNASEVLSAIGKKMQNFYKVREDDTEFASNGIIDGQEYKMVESGYNDAPLKQIPIFFVNPVEQGELLKDFSSGIAHLASTAINYNAMNDIADVVEFIGDFASDKAVRDKDPKADHVGNAIIGVTYDLVSNAKKNGTAELVEGYLAQHLYGQKLDPESFGYKVAKPILNLIGYTSFKGLATNVKGALSNYLVGEFQMLIEAGAGEFYNLGDYAWAHSRLFGKAGVGGEIMDLFTNNMNSKATLMRELFDPISENFSDKSNKRYYKSWFRQILSKDCSFIGYASGEYLIHYVNMYAILSNQKVLLNGKTVRLYDAFEVTNKQDGNSELKLKQGATIISDNPEWNGKPVSAEFLDYIKNRIKYANDSTHGAMNTEDKGIIHQKLMGRAVMNFRQWMIEHYSRRFRKAHFDYTLKEMREGYWRTFWNTMYKSEETNDAYEEMRKKGGIDPVKAVGLFVKDMITFAFRAQSQWSNLTKAQKANVKRVRTELVTYLALLGMSFAIGEPDKNKKEFWRRWWLYQVKRLQLDTEASMPGPKMLSSGLTILQSPMASVNTLNSFLYAFYGVYNGDLTSTVKSGPHKGENKYWRNIKKYIFPFFKDWEQLQKMDTDDSIFQVFQSTPSNY